MAARAGVPVGEPAPAHLRLDVLALVRAPGDVPRLRRLVERRRDGAASVQAWLAEGGDRQGAARVAERAPADQGAVRGGDACGVRRMTPLSEKEFQRQVTDLAEIYGWSWAHFRPAQTS